MRYLVILIVFIASCSSQGLEKTLIGDWHLVKKEKFIKIMSDSYAPIPVEILPNESYNFTDNKDIIVNSGIGKPHRGNWQIQDSVIKISLNDESKEFKINQLSNDTLVMLIDQFRLTFVINTTSR